MHPNQFYARQLCWCLATSSWHNENGLVDVGDYGNPRGYATHSLLKSGQLLSQTIRCDGERGWTAVGKGVDFLLWMFDKPLTNMNPWHGGSLHNCVLESGTLQYNASLFAFISGCLIVNVLPFF